MLMLFSARELLGAGVTTGRDLGARSFLDVDGHQRDRSRMGSPRGHVSSVLRDRSQSTGGHCWFMGGETDAAGRDPRIMVRLPPQDGRRPHQGDGNRQVHLTEGLGALARRSSSEGETARCVVD